MQHLINKIFTNKDFANLRETNRLEIKKAKDGLPLSLWETYSSFANSDGGLIILGVAERSDGSWHATGLKDPDKLKSNFWNTIHDTKKVSINLLSEKNVSAHEIEGNAVLTISVPRAKREDKPVYINDDLFGGSYRRNWEGDYHCTKAEVKSMLRDAIEESYDTKIVEQFTLSAINHESLRAYRNFHKNYKPEHVFHRLNDEEYMLRIGAAATDDNGVNRPTIAGLLMFGEEYNIVRELPEYFLDYREILDPSTRWIDRVQSSSGDWTGNIQDFFFRVNSKISRDIKTPFKLNGITRQDDTDVHKAIREALVNCLVNADYYMPQGVVVKKEPDTLVIENPGSIRTGKQQMLRGGISDPRNKTLMKMFNLIGIGERAGSGIPDIFQVWQDNKWVEPIVEETFNPDRTKLTLKFIEKTSEQNKRTKQANKTSEQNKRTKQANKTSEQNKRTKTEENKELIRDFLNKNGFSKTCDIANMLRLSPARTRVILNSMPDVVYDGTTNKRKYGIKIEN